MPFEDPTGPNNHEAYLTLTKCSTLGPSDIQEIQDPQNLGFTWWPDGRHLPHPLAPTLGLSGYRMDQSVLGTKPVGWVVCPLLFLFVADEARCIRPPWRQWQKSLAKLGLWQQGPDVDPDRKTYSMSQKQPPCSFWETVKKGRPNRQCRKLAGQPSPPGPYYH